MPRIEIPVAVAILDDYQNVARALADGSCLNGRATITVFNSHLTDSDALIERLKPFDVVCVCVSCANAPLRLQADAKAAP